MGGMFGTPEEAEGQAREAAADLAARQEAAARARESELADASREMDQLATGAYGGITRRAGDFLAAWDPAWAGPVFTRDRSIGGGTETRDWTSANSDWGATAIDGLRAFFFELRVRVEIRGDGAGTRDAGGMKIPFGLDADTGRLWVPEYTWSESGPELTIPAARQALELALTRTGKWDYISDKRDGFILELYAERRHAGTVSFAFDMLESDMREAIAASAAAAIEQGGD